jgi:hypothetical protein
MDYLEPRAPLPKGGDPNVKTLRMSLTPSEWRKLRAWAAEDDTSVEATAAEILRQELAGRPRLGF